MPKPKTTILTEKKTKNGFYCKYKAIPGAISVLTCLCATGLIVDYLSQDKLFNLADLNCNLEFLKRIIFLLLVVMLITTVISNFIIYKENSAACAKSIITPLIVLSFPITILIIDIVQDLTQISNTFIIQPESANTLIFIAFAVFFRVYFWLTTRYSKK